MPDSHGLAQACNTSKQHFSHRANAGVLAAERRSLADQVWLLFWQIAAFGI